MGSLLLMCHVHHQMSLQHQRHLQEQLVLQYHVHLLQLKNQKSHFQVLKQKKNQDVEPLSENDHTLPSKSSSESIPESSRTTYCALYVPDPSRMDFKITFTSYCSLANTYPKAGINAI